MTRRTERIVRAVVIVTILAAVVWFALTVRWAETWAAIQATSLPLLVAATIVNLVSLLPKAIRWWVFLRPVGVQSLALAVRATFAGAAVNNLLVANSGEAAKVVVVSRAAHVSSDKILATVALERLFEVVGYVVLLALTISLFTIPEGVGDLGPFAAVSLVVVFAFLWYLVRHPETADLPALEGEGLFRRAKHYGRSFFRTMASISTGPRFAAATALSLLVWALQVATYQLTARAAHFDISIVGTIAAMLAVNVGFATRATPGNVGVFQMMYAMTAVAFGMDKEQATGVAFLIQIQQIVPVTIIGLLASPGVLGERRDTARAGNVLPGEPDPPSTSVVPSEARDTLSTADSSLRSE